MNQQISDDLYRMTYGHVSILTPFGDKYVINADVTASGYPNKLIESIMEKQILPYYSNTHSNAYCGRLMSHYIEKSKDMIRQSVKAHKCDRIIFTGNGCSGAVNHLIHCLNLNTHNPKSTVIMTTRAEHHSNLLPFTHLPVTLIYIPLFKDTGLINQFELKKQLDKFSNYDNIIASFNATSNVTGVTQEVDIISELVHKYSGLMFWDYAASAPYIPINMHKDHLKGQYFDAIFISTHKFFGGPGTPGLLIANQNLFRNNVPYCPSGGTVRFVCPSFRKYIPNIETKESGGTPDILGCIKSGLVFDLKNRYQSYIIERDQQITEWVGQSLMNIPNLKLLNPMKKNDRQPIFVFTVNQLHYNYIVVLLNDLFGIQTRGGVSCCSLLAQDLLDIGPDEQKMIYNQIVEGKGIPSNYGWCRVSFHYSMPDHLIKYIIDSIKLISQYGYLFIKIYKYDPIKNNWSYCPDKCPWDDFSRLDLSLDLMDQPINQVYLTQSILTRQLQLANQLIQKLVNLN